MRLGDCLRDMQPQSDAAPIGSTRLPETIEQSFALFFRDARPRIGNAHAHFAGVDAATYAHPASTRGELQRVADEVVHHLQEPLLVGLNDGARRLRVQLQRDTLFSGTRLKGFHRLAEHVSYVARTEVERRVPGFQP